MKRIRRRVVWVLLAGYTFLLSFWMLIGFGRIHRYTYSEYRYNLKPFETIRHFMQFDRFNAEVWIINLLGNIGVFMPFGLLIPFLFKGSFMKSCLLFFAGLFLLESLQFLSRRGSFDIGDFILNTVGFLIGFGGYRLIRVFKN